MTEYNTASRRNLLARIHIKTPEKFVTEIILNHNPEKYPDPCFFNINDIDLLNRYIERVEEAIKNYSENSEKELEKLWEFYESEKFRVNTQIEYNISQTPYTSSNTNNIGLFC